MLKPVALVNMVIINSISLPQQAGYAYHPQLEQYQQLDILHSLILAMTLTQHFVATELNNDISLKKPLLSMWVHSSTYLQW